VVLAELALAEILEAPAAVVAALVAVVVHQLLAVQQLKTLAVD
jgi:hypothetical protein